MTVIQEGVTQEMIDRTQAKFDLWDDIVRRNVLETGTDEEKAKVYALLHDPTIYAYAWFRDDQGKPFKLYSYQDLILNDNHDRVMFAAANQIGKSISLIVGASHFGITNPGKTVLMVSKTLPQSKDLLRAIKHLLNMGVLDWSFDVGDTDTKTEIYFRHFEQRTREDGSTYTHELPQSRIICVPATEAALGYAADLVLVDELAFYENGEHFYNQIIQPRTYATKGAIKVFSNPNGQQGIFWELWNSKRFHKYRFNFLDCPRNTKREFNKIAADLTQEQIDSTLLAEFTNPAGGFITGAERKAIQVERPNELPMEFDGPLSIFFDFAKSMDRTVRIVGRAHTIEGSNLVGVYIYEMKEYPRSTPYNVILDDLVELINRIGFQNITAIGWDNTGVGRGIEDFIKRIAEIGLMCNPVEFSLENKSRIYMLFKLLVERSTRGLPGISMPFVKECDKQLSSLRFKKSPRGHWQVHHANESDRDDFCFVAGTMVATPNGEVPIESLRVGDLVLTRKGPKEIIGTANRLAKVISRFGLMGTPDHPFITKEGIVKFKYVRASDITYTWNEKLSCIEESNIIDILNRRGANTECITGPIQIETKHLSHCTELFGRNNTVQYLEVKSFTIKMETPLTIQSTILNASRDLSIKGTMHLNQKESKLLESIFQNTPDHEQQNGMDRKKEFVGTKNMQKQQYLGKRDPSYVQNVRKNSGQNSKWPNSNIVPNYVPEEYMTERVVYNIAVSEANEYFANGILVHNCDAIAGLCSLIIQPDAPPVSLTFIGNSSFKEYAEEAKKKYLEEPSHEEAVQSHEERVSQ